MKKNVVTKQLTVATDFHIIEKKMLWKSMATINCLVTNIFQNIFYCVPQRKETHTGLGQVEGE